jgi:hypothetical protein
MWFEGDIQADDTERCIQLEFLRKRHSNCIISRLSATENEAHNITLQISRGEKVTYQNEVMMTQKTLGCHNSLQKKVEKVERTEYSHFARMNVNLIFPTRKYMLLSYLFCSMYMFALMFPETISPFLDSHLCLLPNIQRMVIEGEALHGPERSVRAKLSL